MDSRARQIWLSAEKWSQGKGVSPEYGAFRFAANVRETLQKGVQLFVLSSACMPHDVLLVDDHKIMRDGLKAILGRGDEFRVVGEAENGADAVRFVKRALDEQGSRIPSFKTARFWGAPKGSLDRSPLPAENRAVRGMGADPAAHCCGADADSRFRGSNGNYRLHYRQRRCVCKTWSPSRRLLYTFRSREGKMEILAQMRIYA
jgi:hypothetical protein